MENRLLKYVVSVFLMVWGVSGLNAQIPQAYEMATWQGFKKAAVTYTFDDNTANQLPVALPLFDKYNFKATFFPVIDWNPDWATFKKAAENGHEIGSHTVSHANLGSLGSDKQEVELQKSQSIINSEIPDAKCVTVAYPFCSVGDPAIIQKYYIAGRICSQAIEPSTPADFYRISSIIAGSQGMVKTASDFNAKVEAAAKSGGWCVFLIHGVDDDHGFSPLKSTELAAHLKYMNDHANDYWIGTFGNLVKYIKERDTLQLSELVLSADSLKLTVSDKLDKSVYNVPVTIRRKLPEGWKALQIFTAGNPIKSEIVKTGSGKFVVFDVVPGQDEFYLVKLE